MKIAVYGASGYQGRLVLAELVRQAVEPVLVGRDAGRLRGAAGVLGLTGAERRVADTADHDALVAALRDCAAVVNCAGPFTVAGAAVVRAAIAAGCHYTDTAGEQVYVKTVFDTFAAPAERAGVTVVPACTDGCLPVDLVAHRLAAGLGPVDRIVTTHVVTGGGLPSRGSLRSVLASLDVIASGGLTYVDGDWVDGDRVDGDRAAAPEKVDVPGVAGPVAVARFAMPEVVTIPRHVDVRFVRGYGEAALAARLGAPVPALDTLPEGPGDRSRAEQRFTYVVDAFAASGVRARGVVEGTDTYGTTAVIAVEAARRLAAGGTKAGVLAPAQAFEPAGASDMLDVLTRHGVRWRTGPYSATC